MGELEAGTKWAAREDSRLSAEDIFDEEGGGVGKGGGNVER